MSDRRTLRYVRLNKHAVAPAFAHGASEDAGMDLRAAEEVELGAREWKAVGTGLSVEIPPGYEGQVRPRSGLARKHGVTLLNSPGTVDPGYRGELQVTLINFGHVPYRVRVGDRIAQLVIGRYADVQWVEVESLSASDRGADGFGSTGR